MRVRDYLSYSQLRAYESGQYEKRYLKGIKFSTEHTRFGSKVAEGLEDPSQSDLDNIEAVLEKLPELEEREKTIETTVDGIRVLGRIDHISLSEREIRDEKTTFKPWTQSKVDKNDQLTFYSMLTRYKYGWIPNTIAIDCLLKGKRVNPETVEEELWLTGEVKSITTTRSIADIIKMKKRVKKAWEGIGELCRRYNEKEIHNLIEE